MTVESTGALPPERIVTDALSALDNKLNSIRMALDKVKALGGGGASAGNDDITYIPLPPTTVSTWRDWVMDLPCGRSYMLTSITYKIATLLHKYVVCI